MLEGKIAIITGAGRGIGAAVARLMVAHGAHVVLGDLDPAPLHETAGAITAAGGRATAVPGDVTQPGYAEQIVAAALQQGGLDIIVANAGYTWDVMAHKMTDEQWDAMLAVHLTAPFRLARAAAPFIRETARREIAEQGQASPRKLVFVSSTSGTRGNLGQANYAAAKSGVLGLAKSLSKEWGAFNVQSNAVAFGLMDTRLTAPKEQGAATERAGQQVQLGVPSQLREMAKLMIPMGRTGSVEEAAGPILFLASPLSNYVSGQVIEVTGGL
ncbi:MAG: SDR family oxidoreductase [Roseiflexaceae bacterium]|nr:SDR family oxidoreductase [Roseiflexaceae bacterium]